ncbi:MAG: hypothetical protein RL200_999, partial [Actinomycetota bacterium]
HWADPNSAYHREEFDPNRRIILHCMPGRFECWSQEGRLVLDGHKNS